MYHKQGELLSFGCIVVYGKDEHRINSIVNQEKLSEDKVIRLNLERQNEWVFELIGAPICMVYGINPQDLLKYGVILSKDLKNS